MKIHKLIFWLLAFFLALPLFLLGTIGVFPEWGLLSFFFTQQWLGVTIQTVILAGSVAVLATLLGAFLGFIFAHYTFPHHSLCRALVLLPLAFPVYVYAFIAIGFYELVFETYERPFFLMLMTFSLATYPYVFLLSEQAFSFEDKHLKESAEIFGFSGWSYFYKVRWPLVRPFIYSGSLLVVMECLSDFGGVVLFRYDTYSTLIYTYWYSYYSLPTASFISLLLLLLVIGVLFFQQLIPQYSFIRSRVTPRPLPYPWVFYLILFVFLSISVFLPTFQLLYWSFENFGEFHLRPYLENTVFFGVLGCVLIVSLSLILVYLEKITSSRIKVLLPYLLSGYALPGTLLAVAVSAPVFLFRDLFASATLMGFVLLLYAYWIRFSKVSYDVFAREMSAIPHEVYEASLTLTRREVHRVRYIFLPLLRPAIVTASFYIFLEIMKELPMTLMLRPLGWDTLAVRVFEYTTESEWQQAAPPALFLCLVGFVGVLILDKWVWRLRDSYQGRGSPFE